MVSWGREPVGVPRSRRDVRLSRTGAATELPDVSATASIDSSSHAMRLEVLDVDPDN